MWPGAHSYGSILARQWSIFTTTDSSDVILLQCTVLPQGIQYIGRSASTKVPKVIRVFLSPTVMRGRKRSEMHIGFGMRRNSHFGGHNGHDRWRSCTGSAYGGTVDDTKPQMIRGQL